MNPWVSPPPMMALSSLTASMPSCFGSCWTTARHQAAVDPGDDLRLVRSQPMILTVAACPGSSAADGADRGRLAGGVDEVELRLRGHQVLGGGCRLLLDVVAVDALCVTSRRRRRRPPEAVLALVLDEGVLRVHDAVALPVGEPLVDHPLAGSPGLLVVDADEGVRDALVSSASMRPPRCPPCLAASTAGITPLTSIATTIRPSTPWETKFSMSLFCCASRCWRWRSSGRSPPP